MTESESKPSSDAQLNCLTTTLCCVLNGGGGGGTTSKFAFLSEQKSGGENHPQEFMGSKVKPVTKYLLAIFCVRHHTQLRCVLNAWDLCCLVCTFGWLLREAAVRVWPEFWNMFSLEISGDLGQDEPWEPTAFRFLICKVGLIYLP